jgi:hypothetical protein
LLRLSQLGWMDAGYMDWFKVICVPFGLQKSASTFSQRSIRSKQDLQILQNCQECFQTMIISLFSMAYLDRCLSRSVMTESSLQNKWMYWE